MQRVFLLLALAVSMTAGAQTNKKSADKTAAIKSLVESQNYIFKPQTVLPMSGRTHQVNYDYRLTVTTTS
ncbi:MAG TPA: DUF4251 domain-containing protein, partial [Puia sp.]|nr:DUF4251 domain-containing protein [Puia sp.]